MNKQEALAMLRASDHGFLGDETCLEIAGAFGAYVKPYLHYANPEDPKGLTFHDGRKSAIGLGAHELAVQICDDLQIEYPDCYGRGFQLRVCCDAIEKWMKADA